MTNVPIIKQAPNFTVVWGLRYFKKKKNADDTGRTTAAGLSDTGSPGEAAPPCPVTAQLCQHQPHPTAASGCPELPALWRKPAGARAGTWSCRPTDFGKQKQKPQEELKNAGHVVPENLERSPEEAEPFLAPNEKPDCGVKSQAGFGDAVTCALLTILGAPHLYPSTMGTLRATRPSLAQRCRERKQREATQGAESRMWSCAWPH